LEFKTYNDWEGNKNNSDDERIGQNNNNNEIKIIMVSLSLRGGFCQWR